MVEPDNPQDERSLNKMVQIHQQFASQVLQYGQNVPQEMEARALEKAEFFSQLKEDIYGKLMSIHE